MSLVEIKNSFSASLRKQETDSLILSRRTMGIYPSEFKHQRYEECLETFNKIQKIFWTKLNEYQADQKDTLKVILSPEVWGTATANPEMRKVIEVYCYEKEIEPTSLQLVDIDQDLLIEILTMKKWINDHEVREKINQIRCALSSSKQEVHASSLNESGLMNYLRLVIKYHRLATSNLVLQETLWSLCNYSLSKPDITMLLVYATNTSYFRDLANLVSDPEIMTQSNCVDILETILWGLANLIGKTDVYTKSILSEGQKLYQVRQSLTLYEVLKQAIEKVYLSNSELKAAQKLMLAHCWFSSNLVRNISSKDDYHPLSLELVTTVWHIYNVAGHLNPEIQVEAIWAISYLLGSRKDVFNRISWVIHSGALKDILNQLLATRIPLLLKAVLKIIHALAVDLPTLQDVVRTADKKSLPEVNPKFEDLCIFTPLVCRFLKYLATTDDEQFAVLAGEAMDIWATLVVHARKELILMQYELECHQFTLEIVCANLIPGRACSKDLRSKAVQLAFRYYVKLDYLPVQNSEPQFRSEEDDCLQYILMDLDMVANAGDSTSSFPSENQSAHLDLVLLLLLFLEDSRTMGDHSTSEIAIQRSLLLLEYMLHVSASPVVDSSPNLFVRLHAMPACIQILEDYTLTSDQRTNESAARILDMLSAGRIDEENPDGLAEYYSQGESENDIECAEKIDEEIEDMAT